MQRRLVVDRLALAPFVRVQWLAGGILDDEMRVVLHAVDLAAAEQGQRPGRVHRIGAELQAGGARVEDDDGVAHGRSLRGFGVRMAGSRASASAYSTAAAAEKRRAAAVSARLVRITGTRAPTTRPAVCASAMKARFL